MLKNSTVVILPDDPSPNTATLEKAKRSRIVICVTVTMLIVSSLCLTAYIILSKPTPDVVPPNMRLSTPLPYVRVSGRDVVDETGKVVKLRGVNVGGWFAPESWMCGFKGLRTDWDYYDVADARFGEEKSRELFQVWNDNFFTEEDFNMMAALGYNYIRFPLHFRNFQYRNVTWIRKADGSIDFDQLDKFVAMAGSYGVYVQLDLRVWNGRDILYEGISKAEPWMSPEEIRQTTLWRAQAVDFMGNVTQHFIGNPNILGIDAVNEPVPSYGDTLMIEMYNRVRSVDPQRMFIREYGVDRVDPIARGWVNVMHSFHVYPNFTGRPFTLDEFKEAVNDRISDNYAIPYQCGEFQLTPQEFAAGQAYMEERNINWAVFTFKGVKQHTWSLFNYDTDAYVDFSTDSFEKIKYTWETKLGKMNFRKMRSPLADVYLDNTKVWF